jgi:CRP-like cAMP-binding protein
MIAIMQDAIHTLFRVAGRTVRLSAQQSLFHIGEPVEYIYRVRQGCVVLSRQTLSGTNLVLHVTKADAVLAEASLYSSRYHCDAIAQEPSLLQVVSRAYFSAQLDENKALARAWARSLAMSMQEARNRAEIRTLRTVAERLDAWQSMGRVIPEKGQWQDVAVELGVSREALYRELARSRKNSDS